MGVAAIATIIISIVLGVDSATAQVIYKNKVSSITREANKLATQLAKDSNLVNKLLQAQADNNNKLLQSLLMASPGGARLKALEAEYAKSNATLKDLRKREEELQTKTSKLAAETNQKITDATTSGSAVVDLISGAVKDSKLKDSKIIKRLTKGLRETMTNHESIPTPAHAARPINSANVSTTMNNLIKGGTNK